MCYNSCWNLKKSGGTVWFHWMKLSERMECKHFDSIGLTVCMVEGTESGAWIYNTKIQRNWTAFPNWLNLIKCWKVKVKDEKNCFQYRNIEMAFIDIGRMVGVWVGGILCKRDQEPHVFLYISDKNGTSKLNKLTIFDQKWNFWNLVAKFDK